MFAGNYKAPLLAGMLRASTAAIYVIPKERLYSQNPLLANVYEFQCNTVPALQRKQGHIHTVKETTCNNTRELLQQSNAGSITLPSDSEPSLHSRDALLGM